MLSDRCLSVLSVCLSITLVYCGQTVGRIEMKLGMQVGLGPGHIVLDGARSRPTQLCVRWRPRCPLPKRVAEPLPQFSAHVYCGQTAGWMKLVLGTRVGLSPGNFMLDGDPAPSPKKPFPNFRTISIVAKRLDASRCHLV